jgi:hypothetical protein
MKHGESSDDQHWYQRGTEGAENRRAKYAQTLFRGSNFPPDQRMVAKVGCSKWILSCRC